MNCWFKGYFQDMNGTVFRGESAIEKLRAVSSFAELIQLLKEYTGVFSFIIKKTDEVWAATDVARSMPLYYTTDFSVISDDIQTIRDSNHIAMALSDIRLAEMYATSYIGFQNTIYENVKQIELGCAVKFYEDGCVQTPYFIHARPASTFDEAKAVSQLDQLTASVVERLKKVVENRSLVLSLSGGYDSRYLACAFKRAGIDNVICYTYGRSDSFDVIESKKVAETLGYKWHNIYYNKNDIQAILNNSKDYFDFAERPDYIVYLQNYLAVKKLSANHLIPDNAVFVTGLCNDMPTGYYIPTQETVLKYGYTNKAVAEYVISNRFVRVPISSMGRDIFIKDIIDYLNRMDLTVTDYQSFVSALDALETANSHSRCYLNMNAVHDYFGYEWLIPCWDVALLDFWYSVPADLRRNQYLYELFLLNDLCDKYGVGTKKHINSSASTPWKRSLKRKIGQHIVKICYPLGIPIHRNTDINNFSYLEVILYKNIIQKGAIKADRAALILLLTIYIMEYRYGTGWYNQIRDYIE